MNLPQATSLVFRPLFCFFIVIGLSLVQSAFADDFLREFKEIHTRYFHSEEFGFSFEYGYLAEPGVDPLFDSVFYASATRNLPSISVLVREVPDGLTRDEALTEFLKDISSWPGLTYVGDVTEHVTSLSEWESLKQAEIDEWNRESSEQEEEELTIDGEEVEVMLITSASYEACWSGCFANLRPLDRDYIWDLDYNISLETTDAGRHHIHFKILSKFTDDKWYLVILANNANHYRTQDQDISTWYVVDTFKLLDTD